MPARRPRLLLLNASLAGDAGNTAVLLTRARRLLARRATVEALTLAPRPDTAVSHVSALNARLRIGTGLSPQLLAALARADGLLTRVPQLERKPEKVSEESGFSAAGGYEGNRVAGGM